MKSLLKRIIVIIICISIILASIFSMFKFGVINPFSSFFGMTEILFTNKSYTIVQHFPKKVGFSKSLSFKDFLDEYMKKRGYQELKDQQMGATLVYSNGNKIEKIDVTTNKYYSKWIWK